MNITLNRILFSLSVLMLANLLSAQETVTFRTDRDTYIAGEFVWITASCTESGTANPSTLSRVIYIELLDDKNVPVKQLKLYTKNGSNSTEFELPEAIPTGNYVIRGYTKWMRNYNPALYFTKNIAVINPFSKNSFPESDKVYKTDTLIFYPEGGKIIRNRANKITVQAFDEFGKSKAVSGEIIDPAGRVVLKTETSADGFATFILNPTETGTYKFRVAGSGQSAVVPVPEISEDGINLQLAEESENSLTFNLIATNYNDGNASEGTLQIATSNGVFVKSYPLLLKDNESVLVETERLPAGYLTAFLTDSSGKILSSRYFAASAKSANSLTVTTNKNSYQPRSPVSVEIQNSGNLKNVTISVVKQCLLNFKTQIGKTIRPDNIPFQALARFTENGVSLNDLLLCFTPFGEVLANAPKISFLPEMKGEIISGTILDLDSQKPEANKVFILNFVSKYPTMSFSKTDSLGRFKFIANRFGEQEVVIQPFSRDTTGLNYKVTLDLEYSPEYANHKIHPLFIETENLSEINKSIINMQVNVLYSPFTAYPIIEKQQPKPVSFYGEAEISVLVDKYIELPSIEEIISEIVPFTRITRKKGKVHIKIYEGESLNPKQSDSFCMVDGVPVRNHNNILKIDHRKVEKIDVVNLDYFIQENKLGNILNVITRTGDMSAFDFDARLFRQVHSSYSPVYLFNSPDYSADSIRNSRIPDFRNLLYWNPEIEFEENGKSNITFYTSDEATKYTVVVEGVNSSGIIERQHVAFEVTEE